MSKRFTDSSSSQTGNGQGGSSQSRQCKDGFEKHLDVDLEKVWREEENVAAGQLLGRPV